MPVLELNWMQEMVKYVAAPLAEAAILIGLTCFGLDQVSFQPEIAIACFIRVSAVGPDCWT